MRPQIWEIADAIEHGLRRACEQCDLEQVVSGIDIRNEIELHPLLESALREAGFGVFREQRYPADRSRMKISQGERCDFVITNDQKPLKHPDAPGTLFDSPDAVELEDAFWLEVKVVSQFTMEGANYNYSSELLSTVRKDISKLSKDIGILHAGLLIILFVRDQIVAEHDLKIWQDRCLARSLPIGAPSLRQFPFTDRHGNAVCAIALYPVMHL